jgi:hypothetical protein
LSIIHFLDSDFFESSNSCFCFFLAFFSSEFFLVSDHAEEISTQFKDADALINFQHVQFGPQ